MPEFAADAALYFDPANPVELSECLARLLSDESSMRTLAAKAIERSRVYNWVDTASATWSAITELAERALAVDTSTIGQPSDDAIGIFTD